MARKPRPAPTCAPEPLTPDFIGRTDTEQLMRERISQLANENRQLQKENAYLRQRHETVENALARQLRALQNTVTNLMTVFEQLDKPLVPNPLKAVKR